MNFEGNLWTYGNWRCHATYQQIVVKSTGKYWTLSLCYICRYYLGGSHKMLILAIDR